jgi:plastocyanin
MGDPVKISGISPGRPATRGIFFAWVLSVGALLAALAMLAPAAGAQPMYYQQDQMMQPQEQQMQAPAPAAQYVQEAPAPTTAADQYAAAPSTTPTAARQQGQGTTVSIQDFFFAPAQVNVQPGTTVTWVNNGSAPHTVTADDGSFDSETLQPGQSFSFTFANVGTFSYHCEIHPSMTGSVTVGGGVGAATPRASAQAPPAGGGHALPGTGGPSPLLPVSFLLLGCGALGVFALRRVRRTSAAERDV